MGKNNKPIVKKIYGLKPKITFSRDAWEDIQAIIKMNPSTEVTFHGEVFFLPGNTYYIDRIYVFRQFVSSIHVEMALEGNGTMAEYIEKIATGAEIDGYEWELNIDKCVNFPPSFFFHGHLHPGTLLEHSSVDTNGYLGIHEQLPFYIDAIFTRDGKNRFWFYGMGGYIKIVNCKFRIEDESKLSFSGRESRNQMIAQMISERVILASHGGWNNGRDF